MIDREEARVRAAGRRHAELFYLIENPEDPSWPDLTWGRWGRLLRGEPGVTRPVLARALGCSPNVLKTLLPSPVGEIISGRTTGLHPVFEPNLLVELSDHPQVKASRERRERSVSDTDRKRCLEEFFESARDHTISHVFVSNFRTIGAASFPTSSLSVLFGKNGAGKSSILDAIDLELKRSSYPAIPAKGDKIAEFVVSLTTDASEDDLLVLAAYMALGLKAAVRNDVEEFLLEILTRPLAIGTNERWHMAVDRELALRTGAIRGRLQGALKGRLLPELHSACGEVVDEPVAVSTAVVSIPPVTVSALASEPETLQHRLFEEIGAASEDFCGGVADRTQFSHLPDDGNEFSDDEDELDDYDGEEIAGYEGEAESIHGVWEFLPTERRVELGWIDAAGERSSSSAAVGVDLFWKGERLARIGLQDLVGLREGLRDILGRLSSSEAPRSAEETEAVFTLLRLSRQMGAGVATSPWAAQRPVPRAVALAAVVAIEALANRYCPDFALEAGRILLIPPGHESAGQVEVGLSDSQTGFRPLAELPSGVARWVALATDLAMKAVIPALTGGGSRYSFLITDPNVSPLGDEAERTILDGVRSYIDAEVAKSKATTILLADEPELHLHPAAQEEIVRWCSSASERWTTIVASHAPAFLGLSPSAGNIIRIFRHPTEGTKTVPLEGWVLESIDELSESLGLGKRDRILQLVRGLVFVEGMADYEVLKHLAEGILTRQRLAVIPIHGHSQTKGIANGELALALGLPLAVIFDNITRADIQQLEADPNSKVSDEARSAWRLLSQRERGLDCTVIPFESGDICGALPENTIRARYPRFKSWDRVVERWARDPSIPFKHAFLDSIGAPRNKDFEVIVQLAEAWDGNAPLPSGFGLTLRTLEAWADSLGLSGSPAFV